MDRDFKIHCIALTKNEADVVGYCLGEASKWADHIYVYDGASTDGTWDIVKGLKNSCVIPWKQDSKVFKEGLRAEVFDEFRHLSQDGDWWVQLNVDEFYPESPREFLARVPRMHNFVWGISVEYFITQDDLNRIDFQQPVQKTLSELRYYKAVWSEPRCFRYRNGLTWHTDSAWPQHVGIAARERIIFKHFPYRSPNQIQLRLDVRRESRARGFEGWAHASESDWREKIVDKDECSYDLQTGAFEFDPAKLPRHIESFPLRFAKRLLHATSIWP
jgi:hypothetical protein